MSRGRLYPSSSRPKRPSRPAARLATCLLTLTLLLRALLPAAQALPALETAAGAGGPPLVICSALGGVRVMTPDGEPLEPRALTALDCLACQGLALGQAPAPAGGLDAPGALLRSAHPRPATSSPTAGRCAGSVQARAPPTSRSPS